MASSTEDPVVCKESDLETRFILVLSGLTRRFAYESLIRAVGSLVPMAVLIIIYNW